jgi:hypothetical protein
MFAMVWTVMVMELPDVTKKVYPSGADLATTLAPNMPVAPLRFSITTGCPSLCDSGTAIARPTTSGELPAGKLTMSLMGLTGHSCAFALRGKLIKITISALNKLKARFTIDLRRIRQKHFCTEV